MFFAQITLPKPNSIFNVEEVVFLRNIAKCCDISNEIVMYLDGPYFEHTLCSISNILNQIYSVFFEENRYIEVFICFCNEEHPLLRISSIRTILTQHSSFDLSEINQRRKARGLSNVSLKTISELIEHDSAPNFLENEAQIMNSLSLAPCDDAIIKSLKKDKKTKSEQSEYPYRMFSYVAVGGTFDRLHPGHFLLLTISAFVARDHLHIGLSGPALLQKKQNASLLQPYSMRRERIIRFVYQIAPSLHVEVSQLFDPVGPVGGEIEGIECLVVSEETKDAIQIVEQKRREKEEIRKKRQLDLDKRMSWVKKMLEKEKLEKREGDADDSFDMISSWLNEESEYKPLLQMKYIIVPLCQASSSLSSSSTPSSHAVEKLSSSALRLLDSS